MSCTSVFTQKRAQKESLHKRKVQFSKHRPLAINLAAPDYDPITYHVRAWSCTSAPSALSANSGKDWDTLIEQSPIAIQKSDC